MGLVPLLRVKWDKPKHYAQSHLRRQISVSLNTVLCLHVFRTSSVSWASLGATSPTSCCAADRSLAIGHSFDTLDNASTRDVDIRANTVGQKRLIASGRAPIHLWRTVIAYCIHLPYPVSSTVKYGRRRETGSGQDGSDVEWQ